MNKHCICSTIKITVVSLCSCIILCLSCGAPFYYEQAHIDKGFTGGVGAGAQTGISAGGDIMHMYNTNYVAGMITPYMRYGFSNNVAILLQASFGKVTMYDINRRQWERPYWRLCDLHIGTKVRVSDKGALRIYIGVPSLLGVSYLYDVKDWVTLNSSLLIGTLTPSIGVTFHPRISENILSHITFNVGGTVFPTGDFYTNIFPISASFGFGIDGTIKRGERNY